MKEYDESSCVRSLKKLTGVSINEKNIKINRNSNNLGISSWGKIDFLCNHCGYNYVFSDTVIDEKINNDNERKRRKPKAKERFSMAKMVKKAMK